MTGMMMKLTARKSLDSTVKLRSVGVVGLFLFSLMVTPTLHAIEPEIAESIMEGATKIQEATLAKDVEVLVDYMHPSVVNMSGGKQEALRLATEGMKLMERQKLEIKEYEVLPPKRLYEAQSESVAFLATRAVIRGPGVTVRNSGFLVASRRYDADSWTFLDGSAIKDRAALMLIFPGLPENLVIPARQNDVQRD